MPKKPSPPNISLSGDLVIRKVKPHNAFIEPCNEAAGSTLLDEILAKTCGNVKRIAIIVKIRIPSILCT